jgi:DNA-binding LacI/PurR family transcriptional regulator
MRPTLQDMASILNLSKSTVSRALAGDPRVAEATRNRVVALAERIGYRPNPIAQGLATRRTNIIGLAVPHAPRSLSDPFYLEFLGAAGDTAMRCGYSLLLCAADSDGAGGYRSHMELADPARIDGMILTEPRISDERIQTLKERNLPFVFLGMAEDPDVSWVSGDNTGGAAKAVSHLIDLGHKRIACVTGPFDQTASETRFRGYMTALAEAAIPLDRNIVASGDFTQTGGYQAMKSILRYDSNISAVFASNDVMAFGVMRALREAGLVIPDDVSVMGFDGIPLTQYVDPQLATVRQPISELGSAIVEVLVEQMNGKGLCPVHKVLNVEYQPAGSVSHPPYRERGEALSRARGGI